MEKTALREGGSFRIDSLNTVARPSEPPRSRNGECRMEGRKSKPGQGLFSLPPDAVAGVLEDHSDRRERISDSVRGGEVFALACLLAQLHDEVQQAIDLVSAFRGRLEDSQHLAERRKRLRGIVEGSLPHA